MSSEHPYQHSTINQDNYEEYLLLYIDNELSVSDRIMVEEFLEERPELQVELNQFLETKCIPEPVVGFDKTVLFKNTEQDRKIIYIRWSSIAVAASLVLFFGLRLFRAQETSKPIENQSYTSSDKKNNNPIRKEGILEVRKPLAEDNKNPVQNKEVLAQNKQHKKGNTVLFAKKSPTSISTSVKDADKTEQMVDRSRLSNNLPVNENMVFASNTNEKTNQRSENTHQSINEGSNTASQTLTVKDDYATEALTQAKYAVYMEDDHSDDSKGIKNLIRKANRIYNKVTNPEPDKTIIRFAKRDIGIPR